MFRPTNLSIAAAAISLLLLLTLLRLHATPSPIFRAASVPGPTAFDPVRDATKLSFTDQECSAWFPGAFLELERAVTRGRVGREPEGADLHQFLRARIYNGRLYIVSVASGVWSRQSAILHQIHRAILTAPDPDEIPNIDFRISVNDHPASNIWSLSRSDAEDEINDTWLMPDYGYWSWPEPHIGSLQEAREKIAWVDGPLSWAEKKDLAVWRGTKSWNEALRGKLLEVAGGRPWSDVQELDWKTNALEMEAFCKYKFLIYTEGVTYSGRLRYFQHCRSIIVTPKLSWHQIHSPLISGSGPNQNIVYVKDDWSDLEETINHLLANPAEAERIANNTVDTFRDRYLTPAAETCYWRKLFRAWESVTDPLPEVIPFVERGTSWESYVLMGALDWEAHA